jgi:hypothetical protein
LLAKYIEIFQIYSAAVNMLNRGQSPVLGCCYHPRGLEEDALKTKNTCENETCGQEKSSGESENENMTIRGDEAVRIGAYCSRSYAGSPEGEEKQQIFERKGTLEESTLATPVESTHVEN